MLQTILLVSILLAQALVDCWMLRFGWKQGPFRQVVKIGQNWNCYWWFCPL